MKHKFLLSILILEGEKIGTRYLQKKITTSRYTGLIDIVHVGALFFLPPFPKRSVTLASFIPPTQRYVIARKKIKETLAAVSSN